MREANLQELAATEGGYVNPCPDDYGICDPFPDWPWPIWW